MTCDSCFRAATDASIDDYAEDCDECTARALAHVGDIADAAQAGAITPHYRLALQEAFGEDWLDGHARVKFWADRLGANPAR